MFMAFQICIEYLHCRYLSLKLTSRNAYIHFLIDFAHCREMIKAMLRGK